ncbi:hypothetical protein SSX86_003842 [Deinandra increscens subsp. villosa]|uniref:Amidase domain-containing protein n=1 Tax=Deinandra increscens subsp. villosa TaxID=3103831 RepID=A0AAP0DQY8_9ASTR
MTVMRALPATTSYAVGIGGSSFRTPPTNLRSRRFIVAKEGDGFKMYVSCIAFRDPVCEDIAEAYHIPANSFVDKCICLVSRAPSFHILREVLGEIYLLCGCFACCCYFIEGRSSSGPASIVASEICSAALGTDGGGSVRIPSSLCGVVGLKTTYGRTNMKGTNCIQFFVSMTTPLIGTMALETGETNLKVTGNLMRFILAGNIIGLPAISVAVTADPTCDDSELPPSAAAAANPTCVLFSAYQSHPKVQMNIP